MAVEWIGQLIDSKFLGCYVSGIPIGIPTTIHYKKPIETVADKTIYAMHGVETFIVLPYDIFRKDVTNLVPGGVCRHDSSKIAFTNNTNISMISQATCVSSSSGYLVEENSDLEVTIEPEKEYEAQVQYETESAESIKTTEMERDVKLKYNSKTKSAESIITKDVLMGPSAAAFTGINFTQDIKDKPIDEYEPTNSCKARKNKRSNVDVKYTPCKQPKIKLISEDVDSTPDDNRRKSSRIKSKGFRPDFKAVEHIDGISDIETSESDDDKQTDNTVDADWKNYRVVKVEVFAESDDENAVSEHDVQDSKCVDSITDADFKEKINDSNDDSDYGDPDFCPEESVENFSSFSDSSMSCKNKTHRKGSEVDQYVTVKPKVKRPVSKRAYKTKKQKHPSDQPNSEEADRDIKTHKERIKININEHPDKYDTKVIHSMERQHRSKPKNELVYVCKLCNAFQTQSKDVLEDHIEQHVNGDLECTKCDFKAQSIWLLRQHTRAVHDKGKSIVCHLCGTNLIKSNYKAHMGRVHNDPQYKCKFCTCVFALRKEQSKHENTEHGDKTNWCSKCHQRLPELDSEQFASHIANCVDKVFSCDKCGKTYSNERVMKTHYWRVHTSTRWHPCPKCSFVAKTSTNLARHLKAHDGIHAYRCHECPFSCVQSGQLKSHMRTHSGDKPYTCSECNYAASWNVQLKDHKKIHGLPTAVLCKECRVLFKDGRTIAMHLKKTNHNSGIQLNDLEKI